MEKADAGVRFGSYILDRIILVAIVYALIIPLLMIDVEYAAVAWIIGLTIDICYYTYFFGNGQTLGMKVAKIKLCGTDGTYPIGYARGFLRWLGMLISGLAIGVGFLWILIDKNKQGWHDKIAGTIVVKPIYATDSSSLEGGEYEAF